MSLDRGICSCAELQVVSCYRSWKEACQATRTISTISRHELSSSFFFLQAKLPKEIHTILKETLREHAPLYATIKNQVAQFKCGDFSTCDGPCPGRCKTVTTQEITDQIHELILADHQISAKSIAEQLGISREWVGSISHEDFDMRKFSAKWVLKCLNADQKHPQCQSPEQILEFFRHDPNDFLSQLVTMDKTWLYHYDPETKQQSMEWQHSGSPHPKKFWVQNPPENFSPRFFGIKTASFSLIFFQRAKLSTQSSTHLCWCNWRAFWRKNATERSPRWSCSCTTVPWLTGHLQPRTNAYLGFQCLDHPPYSLDVAPSDYHLFPGLKKTFERSPFFVRHGGHCCHGDLVGQTPFWILSGLQKLEQWAKKYTVWQLYIETEVIE